MTQAKEKAVVLAEQNHWPLPRAQGYVDGEIARKRKTAPTSVVMIGMDDYSAGFRAAYFEHARNTRNAPEPQRNKPRISSTPYQHAV